MMLLCIVEEFVDVLCDGRERAGVQRPQMAEKERIQGDELRLHFSENMPLSMPFRTILSNTPVTVEREAITISRRAGESTSNSR